VIDRPSRPREVGKDILIGTILLGQHSLDDCYFPTFERISTATFGPLRGLDGFHDLNTPRLICGGTITI
jgi:hypothetical protein